MEVWTETTLSGKCTFEYRIISLNLLNNTFSHARSFPRTIAEYIKPPYLIKTFQDYALHFRQIYDVEALGDANYLATQMYLESLTITNVISAH